MKVLVTGAHGFLGRAVVRILSHQKIIVLPIARHDGQGYKGCDLSEPACIVEMLEALQPDAIVNCAVGVNFSDGELERQYAVNILLPGVLANWCHKNGVYFCHISSTAVHGLGQSFGKNVPVQPDTDYGRGKLLAEQLVEASGVNASILRLGGMFGLSGPAHLGINNVIRVAREDGRIPVIVGQGRAKRNYIFVEDAAEVVRYCLDTKVQGVLWAAGKEVLSIAEMMQQICEVYFPSTTPLHVDGAEAEDQVVEVSAGLPQGRTFREALVFEQ